jgi:membrane protease YdiL (CAAX protease family)
MPKKEIALKHATILAAYLLIVWGFYRFLFKLPDDVEELLVKPVVWLLPVFYFMRIERAGLKSIGVTSKNLFKSIYISLALGILFAIEGVLVNLVKYQGVDFSAFLGDNPFLVSFALSFATAVSEEVAFRGFLFNRVWHALGKEWTANIITSFVWALVHIPIAVFWWKLDATGAVGYLILTSVFGIGSAFVFARTKNVASSILLHVMWEWPIVLFR